MVKCARKIIAYPRLRSPIIGRPGRLRKTHVRKYNLCKYVRVNNKIKNLKI